MFRCKTLQCLALNICSVYIKLLCSLTDVKTCLTHLVYQKCSVFWGKYNFKISRKNFWKIKKIDRNRKHTFWTGCIGIFGIRSHFQFNIVVFIKFFQMSFFRLLERIQQLLNFGWNLPSCYCTIFCGYKIRAVIK